MTKFLYLFFVLLTTATALQLISPHRFGGLYYYIICIRIGVEMQKCTSCTPGSCSTAGL